MLEVRRGVAVLEQVTHPGAEVSDKLHAAIQWRLLFPMIGHVLSLPPLILFSLADAGCVVALAFMIVVLRRRGASFGYAALAAISARRGLVVFHLSLLAWLF